MKLTKLQIVGIILASIISVVFTVGAYRYLITSYDYGKPYDDKIISTFGKKNMTFFTGGMNSGVTHKDPNRYRGDDFSQISLRTQLKPDGSMVLFNIKVNGSSKVVGIYIITRLEASTYVQDGNALQERYDDLMNGRHYLSIREGSEYGLDKYVGYTKTGGKRRLADFQENFITMKDDNTPLRILETVSPPSVRPYGGGGVYHYFMYNDLVQVKMHYQKYYLKDWQFIEDSMIAYLDQLYKDAE